MLDKIISQNYKKILIGIWFVFHTITRVENQKNQVPYLFIPVISPDTTLTHVRRPIFA